MKHSVQTDMESDRQVANTLAELIIGGSLASRDRRRDGAARAKALIAPTPAHKSVHKLHGRGPVRGTLWDDDWTCVGGPAGLVGKFLRDAELQARPVALGPDATPPGHQAL